MKERERKREKRERERRKIGEIGEIRPIREEKRERTQCVRSLCSPHLRLIFVYNIKVIRHPPIQEIFTHI